MESRDIELFYSEAERDIYDWRRAWEDFACGFGVGGVDWGGNNEAWIVNWVD